MKRLTHFTTGLSLLAIVSMSSLSDLARANFDSTPHMLVIPSRTGLTLSYKVTQVEKALSREVQEAIIAGLDKSEPHTNDTIRAVSARNSDVVQWTLPAIYWSQGNSVRFTSDGSVKTSIIAYSDFWMQLNKSVSSVPDLLCYPSDPKSEAYHGDMCGAGVLSEQIPFLGFSEPGKRYMPSHPSVEKVREGCIVSGLAPHGYMRTESQTPLLVDVALTFDKLGRLVRFQRFKLAPGIFKETYDYAQFRSITGVGEVPADVTMTERDVYAPQHPEAIDYICHYSLRSLKVGPIDPGVFDLSSEKPPMKVTDYRYPRGPHDVLLTEYRGPSSILNELKSSNLKRGPFLNSGGVTLPDESLQLLSHPLPFRLKDSNGQTIDSSTLHGSAVVLLFWATWCGPCLYEMPMLNAIQRKAKKDGVPLQFIGISVDQDVSAVRKYLKSHEMAFPVALLKEQTDARFGNINGFPHFLILDREGIVRDVFIGTMQKSQLLTRIESHLK